MKINQWNSLTEKEQVYVVSCNEEKSIQIYPNGKSENPVPEKGHVIVYCYSDTEQGWQEIHKDSDLGLNALIAKSWIYVKDLVL